MTYTIQQISTMFGLSHPTLRYYEEIGLLPPVARNSGKQRVYTEEHINRLRAIECFKDAELSIAKMQDFFRYEENLTENIDPILLLVQEQETELSQRIETLQKALSHIQHKVRYYDGIKKAMEANTAWPRWEDC